MNRFIINETVHLLFGDTAWPMQGIIVNAR